MCSKYPCNLQEIQGHEKKIPEFITLEFIPRPSLDISIPRGAFKYYVIMFLTFLGPPTHLFDDVQYCRSSKIAIF